MASKRLVKIKLLSRIKGLNPIKRIAVAHEGRPAVQGITANENFLFRQVNPDIPICVGITKPKNLNYARRTINDKAAIESQGRKGKLHALELGQVGFGLLEIGSQSFFLLRVSGGGKVCFQFFNFLWHRRDFVFHAENDAMLKR